MVLTIIVYKIQSIINEEIILVFDSIEKVKEIISNTTELTEKMRKISDLYILGNIYEVKTNNDLSEIRFYFKHNTDNMKDGIEVLKKIDGYCIKC